MSAQSNQGDKGVNLIAFFLTQFHPIPENDAWWGKGFTEWTNVTKARPLFPGHYQPHLPADLGFYDLRLRQSRHAQIAMAKLYGIDGFCYHYYWFSGRRILEQPLNDMLADPESDMPFCLCWANETWTRRWDGAEHEVLLDQRYGEEDDHRFIADVATILKDPRYIRFRGVPLLIVYQPRAMPDPRRSTKVWRDYCRSVGIPDIHLCAALTHGNWNHEELGFDSAVEFPPHNLRTGIDSGRVGFYRPFSGHVVDYRDVAELYLAREYSGSCRGFRTVFPSWDNTARRGDSAVVVLNGTPENYEHWLSQAIAKTQAEFPGEEGLVFINAWNEWAEGCHLEPDRKFGRQFLEATLRAKQRKPFVSSFSQTGIAPEAQSVSASNVASRSPMSRFARHIPVVGSLLRNKDRRKKQKRKARKFHDWGMALQDELDQIKRARAEERLQLLELTGLRENVARLQVDHARLSESHKLLDGNYGRQVKELRDQVRTIDSLRRELAGVTPRNGEQRLAASSQELDRLRDLYLWLMQESLIGATLRDPPLPTFGQSDFTEGARDSGRDWPSLSVSMIGRRRMANLRQACEAAIREGVPGDFMETGVWRGGACILMRAVIEAYGDSVRRVWAADSFAGLPPPDADKYPKDAGLDLNTYPELAVSLEQVQDNFRRFGLLDDRIVFLKGWFKDTLPVAPVESLAVLRLDGDLYESTMDALGALFRKVSPGGFVIIDDYHTFDACKQAVTDFCRNEGVQPAIQEIDGIGVYWRKI